MSVQYNTDVIIAAGGLAGLSVAYDLLESGESILILDRDTSENLVGLAEL